MNALFPSVIKILSLLGSFIVIAEDAFGPGTGEQKKSKVIADIQEKLPGLASQLGIPDWAVAVFTNAGVLGFLIDALVGTINAMEGVPKAAVTPTTEP